MKQASFFNKKSEVIACGMKRFMVVYDVETASMSRVASSFMTSDLGKTIEKFVISPNEEFIALTSGGQYILLLDASNKQLLHQFRMNSNVTDFSFSPDSMNLVACDAFGEVLEWDLRTMAVKDGFRDVGAYSTGLITVGPNGNYLATGQPSGIVNVYPWNATDNQVPTKTPLKQIQNLTTAITELKFDPSGRILMASSRWKRDSVKLIHLPSLTVFANWPQ